ncbi:Sir2 family NAD-dependent protein deacetylase, partial [Acetomicrobium sp. S15 = DSM 107314]|uniref:Sir2 family NAD-dependent protein deacetylase n=1 Tax=Acetomicrobium sp. S15 = DSM 107314 TaxID=2529858 RepID=UPI003158D12C
MVLSRAINKAVQGVKAEAVRQTTGEYHVKTYEVRQHIEEKKASQCAEMIKKANAIVLLSGAGMSTNAGIPDFRGPQGLYKRAGIPDP